MHAAQVLQNTLGAALSALHAYQRRALCLSVDALVACRRLTLMDLARAWPSAQRVRTPLKRLDRLLGNPRLHQRKRLLYAAMGRWLLRGSDPLIVVDWSDLKHDGRWCLLRAAVPVGGRTLTLLDKVVPSPRLGHGAEQAAFLQELEALIGPGVRPILITDAGFRSDWFAAVESMGWRWIGRLRGRLQVQSDQTWRACTELYAEQTASPRNLGVHAIVKGRPWLCRLVLSGTRQRTGRRSLTRQGAPSADQRHLKAARSNREPVLLACALQLTDWTPARIIAAYRQRMQIELSFRDLKSHRYGQAFEDSLTRKQPRLQMLLLIHALATLAAWLVGLSVTTRLLERILLPGPRTANRYSTIRRGWEALRSRIRIELSGVEPACPIT